jgi:hypothetical protein
MTEETKGTKTSAGLSRRTLLKTGAAATGAIIGSGLITQQLANDPSGGFPDGQYSRLASASLEMWISHYSPADHADRPPTARSTP